MGDTRAKETIAVYKDSEVKEIHVLRLTLMGNILGI